ncbi:hypothetical protein NBO_384g0004 [Nosema bombycis CQ1]|uniref:Uncharacterized protein n=1 Tax=Nosema bombycis (strain CQ1 / CVCC 102059) TaxID=578461 RepID=R0M3S2_NOSB1|nr:hypothetical protein NBO_384g0004 [Nosema bombycis CQ1]|eukprot:EOB12674.1 hypothetical protein NBO_384g0004 [Nosema bombycis CQ1]
MISELWKFINENILNNIFTITLLLLGVVLLIIAVSVGPKLLQKEKRTKRGAIERKVDNAFQKVDNEIGESIVEDYKEEEEEGYEEDKSSVRTRRKSSVVNYRENTEGETLVGLKEANGKEDNEDSKEDGKEDKEDGPGPLNALGQNLVKAPLGGLNNIVKGNGALSGEENLTSSSKESEKNGLGKKKRSSKKK